MILLTVVWHGFLFVCGAMLAVALMILLGYLLGERNDYDY